MHLKQSSPQLFVRSSGKQQSAGAETGRVVLVVVRGCIWFGATVRAAACGRPREIVSGERPLCAWLDKYAMCM